MESCSESDTSLANVLAFIQLMQQRDKYTSSIKNISGIVASIEVDGKDCHLSLDDLVDVASKAAYLGRVMKQTTIDIDLLTENNRLRERLMKLRNAFIEELSNDL